MIPDVEPSTIEHGSERPVYEALRDLLPSEFTVLHSYPWVRCRGGDKGLEEGETDFVVIHRQLGLLVLEVKGGKEIWYQQRQWFRQTNEGPKAIKDPFIHAQRRVRALVDFATCGPAGNSAMEMLPLATRSCSRRWNLKVRFRIT